MEPPALAKRKGQSVDVVDDFALLPLGLRHCLGTGDELIKLQIEAEFEHDGQDDDGQHLMQDLRFKFEQLIYAQFHLDLMPNVGMLAWYYLIEQGRGIKELLKFICSRQ